MQEWLTDWMVIWLNGWLGIFCSSIMGIVVSTFLDYRVLFSKGDFYTWIVSFTIFSISLVNSSEGSHPFNEDILSSISPIMCL